MYKLLRPLLFLLPTETAHYFSLSALKIVVSLGIFKKPKSNTKPVNLFGLTFPNSLGLAAGLDKNGDYIHALSQLGFGFIEIGTVTPRPQDGNPLPRLFRLPQAEAIINRMGFNNKGVDYLVNQVNKLGHRDFVLGINIGKNFDTAVENALSDYQICLEKVFQSADYVTINISSPNTPGLRHLQFGEDLKNLLQGIHQKRIELEQQYNKKLPILVKIAPDMTDEEVVEVAQSILENRMDGIIATNTTISREAVVGLPYAQEQGGLSGKPVFTQSTHVLNKISNTLDSKLPVIGVGGISSVDDAQLKFQSGASLIQIYTGFIYQGPQLVKDIISATGNK
ncbi:MAG: quinone-dependent dihydroorotate dehydrogenase [Gammaproteobacteria bacterium]|nr:quinone-dependent dihydroorotate dehydrogenase [Gammaproteobacteria bacterium]